MTLHLLCSFRPALVVLGLLLGQHYVASGQIRCAERLTFAPVTQPNRVEWTKFPRFTLPFPVVFAATRLGDTLGSPLRHGFQYVGRVAPNEFGRSVPYERRALEYYGVAGETQPWATLESPWGNDLAALQRQWEGWLRDQSGGNVAPDGRYRLSAGLLATDIERFHETDARILALKTNAATPTQYRALPDAQFIAQYKKDMRALYAESLAYLRRRADLTGIPVSTYSDVPIRNTYLNVIGNSWADWTTNAARTSYLVQDDAGRIGGAFYEQLDHLNPSAYYYYDYPNPLAGDYVAYLLFQIEANRAWSQKPVWPWVWMRFHECCGPWPKFIPDFMAEATAIFPVFAGAKGVWFWDYPNKVNDTDVFTGYEHFIHGLYQLSQFSEMLTGDYKLVAETNARDLMDKQLPVWRGIFKEGKLLVAAQNPYARDAQTSTKLTVKYNGWQQEITLTGRQVYLCQFDLTVLAAEPTTPPAVFPNPARQTLTVRLATAPAAPLRLDLLDVNGKTLRSQLTQTADTMFDVATLPAGLYLLRAGNTTQRILIVNE